jgi:hypothetical protein
MVCQVYATEFVPGFADKHSNYFTHKCDEVPALLVPENWDCWGFMKNPAVIVPIPELTVALTHALDFISTTPIAKYDSA